MWHDSFEFDVILYSGTRLIRMWYGSFVRGVAHSYVTWLIDTWHDSLNCETWLIDMWQDSFICDMAHSCFAWLIHIWHEPYICDMTRRHVANHIWKSHITYGWVVLHMHTATLARVLLLSVLLCVAMCCSVLLCVAVCCCVLLCVAVCCCVLHYVAVYCSLLQCVSVELQHTAIILKAPVV